MEILDQMISDVGRNQISFYNPSPTLWRSLSDNLNGLIRTQGINNIQSQDNFNTLFSYVLPLGNLKNEIHLWLYYNLLKERDVFGILDKTTALPSEKYDFTSSPVPNRPVRNNEKIINWDYLISIDTILTIASVNPEILNSPLKICEIGAGWGRIAYYLTQVNKNISYHIFDIPHVLYVSHEYLRNNVKHTNVFSYEESKELLKQKTQTPGISFYTPHFLEEFENKSFDITINVASFQEMNQEQVNGYFNKINQLSKYFYTQQRYSDLDMNYERYPIYDNWEQIFDKDVNFHPLWFEKFFKIN
jgi:hypothetical protein